MQNVNAVEQITKILLDQVDGVGKSESVLNSLEAQIAYQKQMDAAMHEGIASDKRARERSWDEAQKLRLG